MKNPRLTKEEISHVIRVGKANDVLAESKWGADVSNPEKVSLIKDFLLANDAPESIANRVREISDLRAVLDEINNERLIDAAIDAVNNPRYGHIRMQFSIFIGCSRRDAMRFNRLADKILEYGTNAAWPNHLKSGQRSLSSTLANLVPLNDETVFQRYISLCLGYPTGIANNELIFKLHRFRRHRPQVEELCERLLSAGDLAVLHVISDCGFVRFLPALEAKVQAIEKSGNEDFVTRGTYSHLKSTIVKLKKES